MSKQVSNVETSQKHVWRLKLISCTAADDRFLFFARLNVPAKIKITVCFPRTKSQRAVKVWNRCAAFKIWTRCQESWKSSSKSAGNLLKLHKTCHMLCSKRPFHKSLISFQNIERHCSKLAMQTEWHRMSLQHHRASSACCLGKSCKKFSNL